MKAFDISRAANNYRSVPINTAYKFSCCIIVNLNALTKAADGEYVGKFEVRRRVADNVVTNGVAKGAV